MSKKKRRLKKRIKKAQRKRRFNPSIEDKHHLLWQAAHYNSGYARRLRLHPWLIILIPRDTLHREIHSKIGDIPVPQDELCKAVFLELIALENSGQINNEATVEERISWLMDRFTIDEAPRTYFMLAYQKEIVHSFYQISH